MIVCVCNFVTDEQLKTCIKEHQIHSLENLQQQVPVCNQCKCCKNTIENLIDEHINDETFHQLFVDF